MKIKTTTTHTVKFTVEYFEPNEGGMDSDQFGKEHDAIEEAIVTLELAKIAHPQTDWVIVGRVKREVT